MRGENGVSRGSRYRLVIIGALDCTVDHTLSYALSSARYLKSAIRTSPYLCTSTCPLEPILCFLLSKVSTDATFLSFAFALASTLHCPCSGTVRVQ